MESQLVSLSSTFLLIAFIVYLFALIPLSASIKSTSNKPARIGNLLVIIGFLLQLAYFITRWIAQGHAPVSNMYEFLATFSIMMNLGYLITYSYFKTTIIGLFTLPLSMLILAYGSMYSRDVAPLVPSLQSYWLPIHIITVTIAYGILTMSAVAGLIYLLKVTDPNKNSWYARGLEMIMAGIVTVLSYIVSSIFLRGIVGFNHAFFYVDKQGQNTIAEYTFPSLVNFQNALPVQLTDSGEYEPTDHFTTGIELPPIINAQHLNTFLWSVIIGLIVYLIIRLVVRKRLISFVKPLTNRVSLDLMDEIGYRSVIIGFPIFALGGLFFAAIWAQLAWGRFWGWDPKETFAFITFMFYTIFLHLRLNRGYEGEKSAWLAIFGFLIILFNLVVVNMIVSGLHSYA